MYKFAILILLLSTAPVVSAADCEDLRWKLTERDGAYATFRGHVKPGTDMIEMELWKKSRIIGQGTGYPNAGGNWEINIIADANVKKKHRPKFYCTTY